MIKAKCFIQKNYQKRGFKIAMQAILLVWCGAMFIEHGDFEQTLPLNL